MESDSNESDNVQNNNDSSNNHDGTSSFRRSASTASSSSGHMNGTSSHSTNTATLNNNNNSSNAGTDGRSYTNEQADLVKKILKAKEGGRGAHYRVLGVESNADENALKKAYRKLALKLHPDKNSAPHADEAFKALGLAYATLSDTQKRTIYDRYGDEDPDNRGGAGGGMGRHGGVHFNGQEVNPEDIFNMFFGGGMPGGVHFQGGGMPGGFRVYSTGFGPMGGMHMGGMPRRGQRQQQQQQQPVNGFMQLLQLLPVLLLFAMSFFNMGGETTSNHTGGSHYFSLTVSIDCLIKDHFKRIVAMILIKLFNSSFC